MIVCFQLSNLEKDNIKTSPHHARTLVYLPEIGNNTPTKPIHYSRDPGLKIPKKKLPKELLQDLSVFVEVENTDREARAMELATHYGVSVSDILSELDRLRHK